MECKRYPSVVRVLKKFIEVTMITKHVFDLRINLILGKLLASIPAIEKWLIKAIIKDKAVQF